MQQALKFLCDHKEIALATCEGNLPKLRLFQIMKQDGTHLYFATSPEKAVYRQLQVNPNVEILATDGRVSVRCEGMISFEVDEETQRWIYEHNPVLPRLYTSYDKLAYFVLPIAAMDYFDLNPTPPVFRHFDLLTGETGNGYVGERYSKK